MANYRRWTEQYEKDAVEAEQAAELYTAMAEEAAQAPALVAETHALGKAELSRIGVRTWAHATWQVEQMLKDPTAAQGAAAGAKAAAPFNKAYGAYVASQNAYNGAATGYALRVGMDKAAAKKLVTVANQYALEGNKEMHDTYALQANLLMEQAEKFKGMANDYQAMSTKIFYAEPIIQSMAGTAGTFAAWQKNPTNKFGPEQVYPFTVEPPLM